MSLSALWAETNEFIRRLTVDDDRIRTLERKTKALRTGIRDLWAFGGGGGGFSVAEVTGQVTGCNSLGVPGIVVEVTDPSTSALLATTTTDGSGNYALNVAFVGTSFTASFAFGQPGTDPYQRFTAATSSVSLAPGANTVNATLLAASGYTCHPSWAFPLANTLDFIDPSAGTLAAVYGSTAQGIGWQYNLGSVTTPASTGCVSNCAGATGVPFYQLFLVSSLTFQWDYHSALAGTCPSTYFSGLQLNDSTSLSSGFTTNSAPSGTTKLDLSLAVSACSSPSRFFYAGAAVTMGIKEP